MVDMTEDALKQICKELKLYRTPELNDKLYLHYKGFRKIENLDKYTGVRALWLEGNGLQDIEGLEKCVELRSLYIQENCIRKIENLDSCVDLATLNLNKNCIEKIENLGNLPRLETLMLSHNRLEDAADLEQVTECQALTTLDIQQNNITDVGVLDVLTRMPKLRALYLQGNPVIKKIKYYRKKMTHLLPDLRYLDDRPVFPADRLRAVVFMETLASTDGDVKAAQQAERDEIKRQREEKKAKEEANFQAFEDLIRNARVKADTERAEKEQKKLEEEEEKSDEQDDDEDSPWAVGGGGGGGGSTTATTKSTGQRVVEEGHANDMNPFFNEPIVPTTEHPKLKEARDAQLAKIMGSAPAAPQAPSAGAAPPLPPAASAAASAAAPADDDDDEYGWEPPAALLQMQSMIGEVDREKLEMRGKTNMNSRKTGIVVAADVEKKQMAALKKQAEKLNASMGEVNDTPPPVEETNVEELD